MSGGKYKHVKHVVIVTYYNKNCPLKVKSIEGEERGGGMEGG